MLSIIGRQIMSKSRGFNQPFVKTMRFGLNQTNGNIIKKRYLSNGFKKTVENPQTEKIFEKSKLDRRGFIEKYDPFFIVKSYINREYPINKFYQAYIGGEISQFRYIMTKTTRNIAMGGALIGYLCTQVTCLALTVPLVVCVGGVYITVFAGTALTALYFAGWPITVPLTFYCALS